KRIERSTIHFASTYALIFQSLNWIAPSTTRHSPKPAPGNCSPKYLELLYGIRLPDGSNVTSTVFPRLGPSISYEVSPYSTPFIAFNPAALPKYFSAATRTGSGN